MAVFMITSLRNNQEVFVFLKMSLLGKPVYISDHGTAQGIIPRFFLHFEEMSKMAFLGDEERKKIFLNYFNNSLNEFTNFYDSYQNILQLRKDYIEGIVSGKYYKRFENGEFWADKSPEVKIKKAVQDFFKDGKPFLNNFAKSGLLDDSPFVLNKLLVVSEKSYNKAKSEMLPFLRLPGYNILFHLIEEAQVKFKKEFFIIRDEFEHNSLRVQDFEVKYENGVTHITDPSYKGQNIFKLIDKFYYWTLDLIENLSAYFFGLNACNNSKGAITLFYNNGVVDPSKFRYRYTITLDVKDPDLTRLINY